MQSRLKEPLLLLAITLTTFGGMVLEISLTRVLSILFFYNYVFVILSVAVLGIGLGAAVVHQGGAKWFSGERLGWTALAAGASVIGLGLLVVAMVGIDGRLPLALLTLAPFFFIGMTLAAAFTVYTDSSTRLYAADLGGAALGAILVIPLLNWLDALDVLFLSGGLLSLAAMLFSSNQDKKSAFNGRFILTLGLLLVAIITISWDSLAINMQQLALPKPQALLLQNTPGAEIVYSSGDAFAHVDLVQSPGEGQQMALFIDGAAGSTMPRFPTTLEEQQALIGDIGYFPFHRGAENVFIIGPGGGKDVLFALLASSEHIVAAEISSQAVEAVRQFEEFNGNLYDNPRVQVAVDEGRSFLRRSNEQFDLIYLSELVSLAAERNSYILAENYAFTVEAFEEYLDHLTTNGRIALKMYDELTLTRAFVSAVTALGNRGVDQETAVRHIAVLLDPQLVSDKTPFRSPVLLVYGQPITPDHAERLFDDIQAAGFIPLFVPHVAERPPLSLLATGEESLEQLVADFSRGDISATKDDAPFFYEFRRGLPDLLRQLGLAVLIVMLAGIVFLAWRRTSVSGPYWQLVIYFALLGAGFMLVELALIQRLTLFLGHPTLVISVALFAILMGSGLGSLAAGRLVRWRGVKPVIIASTVAVSLLSLAYISLVPWLLEELVAMPQVGRIATAVLLIFPLAFAMGMPFPLGLQQAQVLAGRPMVPLAWGVNGVAAVAGSTAVMVVAILWGFTPVLIIAALAYALVAALSWSLST